MKKWISLLLCLTLLLSLTACGTGDSGETTVIATAVPAQTEPTQAESAPEDGVYTVSTPDEFIDAIGSDRTIHVSGGTLDLSTARSYGKDTGNDKCAWEEEFDGYQLVIHDVKNLTITGDGKVATEIATQPRYAQVLYLRSCENVALSGFTAGHTPEAGSCVGGVVYLEGCTGVSIRDVGLYGCGVIGVHTQNCRDVTVANSDIYECSYQGVNFQDSTGIRVANCRFYDLGKKEDWGADAVFLLGNCSDVRVSDCEIYDNRVDSFISSTSVDQVVFRNNTFRDNELQGCALKTFGNFVTLDGNTFEGVIANWFADGCGAVDIDGNTITEDDLRGIGRDDMVPEETVAPTTVTVKNADEFLAAIAPNAEIIIDAKEIDLSTAKDYGGGPQKYYRWMENFDGPGLMITGVKNLTIRSKDGKTKNHTVCAVPRYADVLYFSSCENLVLSGFTAGHTQEPGECTGGVLTFENCMNVTVNDCGMYGCGILGVNAANCTQITLRKCDIYECSYGGISMYGTTGIILQDCSFRDLGGNNIQLSGCSDVTVDGEPIPGDYNGR